MIRPETLCRQIQEFWRQEKDPKIFLTGWSRGAAIVIQTAALLQQYQGYPMPDGRYADVEAMFLFDAVDKSMVLRGGTQIIPSNVKFCYHAMRNDAAHSRASFGHCGTAMAGANTFLVPRRFYTTHGGMGGVLWGEKGLNLKEDAERVCKMYPPGAIREFALKKLNAESYIDEGDPGGPTKVTVEQEKTGSEAVRAWMWPFLRKHHVL